MALYFDSAASVVEALLRPVYTGEKIPELTYPDNPLYGMCKKMEDMPGMGALHPVPIIDGTEVGASSVLAKALANVGDLSSATFQLYTSYYYAATQIATKMLLISKNAPNKAALVDLGTKKIDSALHVAARRIAISMYTGHAGACGTISSIHATNGTIILTKISDLANFEKGFALVASADGATSKVVGYVVSIDPYASAGPTLIVDTSKTGTGTTPGQGGTPWANGDVLALEGDLANLQYGLMDWFPEPSTITTSDSFFHVNRSYHKVRRAGTYMDFSSVGGTIQESVIKTLGRIGLFSGQVGKRPTHLFMNPLDATDLSLELGAKAVVIGEPGRGPGLKEIDVSYGGFTFQGPQGPVKAFPDQNCPYGRMFPLNLETITLGSIGPAVQLFNLDGTGWLRDPSVDGLNARVISYHQMFTDHPSCQGHIVLHS